MFNIYNFIPALTSFILLRSALIVGVVVTIIAAEKVPIAGRNPDVCFCCSILPMSTQRMTSLHVS